MPAITTVSTAHSPQEWLVWLKRRWAVLAGGALAAGFIAYAVVLALNWPFTKQSVIDVLQEATLRSVNVGNFQKTFFPPGCIVERVRFEHHLHKEKPPIIYVDRLIIHGSYWGLFTAQNRLALVKAVNMHVLVPPAEVHGK